MRGDTQLRLAAPGDVEQLLAMMRELYAHEQVPFNEGRSRRATLQLMSAPQAGSGWMIERAKAPAGYLILTFGFSLEYGGWHGFIDELFVLAPFRSQGLGAAAVRHAQSQCAGRGMSTLLLEADLENEGATRLYRRLGFREHRRRLMSLTV